MRNCATIAPHRSPHDALLAAQMRPELTRDGLGLTELEFVLAMLIELGIVEWGKVPQNGQSMGKVPTCRCHQTSAPVPPQGALLRASHWARLAAPAHVPPKSPISPRLAI